MWAPGGVLRAGELGVAAEALGAPGGGGGAAALGGAAFPGGAFPEGSLAGLAVWGAASPAEAGAALRGPALAALRPGGRAVLVLAQADGNGDSSAMVKLKRAALVAGLAGAREIAAGGGRWAAVAAEKPAAAASGAQPLRSQALGGAKSQPLKSQALGGAPSQPLRSRDPGGAESQPLRPQAPQGGPAPTTGAGALGDGEDDLIDEDSLLEPGDLRAGPIEYEGGGKKKSKACKNCSCGRAELEAAEEKAEAEQKLAANPESACGRCTMGDAFRCASCPSRGLPNGERKTVNVDAASQRVTLSASLLAADI